MISLRKETKSFSTRARFLRDQSGAMTIDWVVLSSTLVILGAVIIGMYREGVYNAANAINESIVNQAPDPSDAPWWGSYNGGQPPAN